MNALIALIPGFLSGRMDSAPHWAMRQVVLYGLAGFLILCTLVAGIISLGLYLVPYFGAAGAALVVAGITLAIAAVLILVAVAMDRSTARRQHKSEQALVASTALALVPRLLNSRSPLSLLAAGGLGYLAAEYLRNNSTSGH
jgi:Kef-type K+ transport system membrane component KefB